MMINAALQPLESTAATPNANTVTGSAEQNASFASLLFLTLQFPQATHSPISAPDDAPAPVNGFTVLLSDMGDGDAGVPFELNTSDSVVQRNAPVIQADDALPVAKFSLGVTRAVMSPPSVPAADESREFIAIDVGSLPADAMVAPAEVLQAVVSEIAPSDKNAEPEAPADDIPRSTDSIVEQDATDDRQPHAESFSFQALAPATTPVQAIDPISYPFDVVDRQAPRLSLNLVAPEVTDDGQLRNVELSFQTAARQASISQAPALINHITGIVDDPKSPASPSVTLDRTQVIIGTDNAVAEPVLLSRQTLNSQAHLSGARFDKNESAASVELAGGSVPIPSGQLDTSVASTGQLDPDGGGWLNPKMSQRQSGSEPSPTAAGAPNSVTEIHSVTSNQTEQRSSFFAGEHRASLDSSNPERYEADRQTLSNVAASMPTIRRSETIGGVDVNAVPWRPVIDHVAGHITSHLRIGSQEAVIQLEPPELGKIKIDLRMEDGKLHARIAADTMESRALIETHLSELRHALAAGRIEVVALQVTQNGWNSGGGDLMQDYQQSAQGRQGNGAAADRGDSSSSNGADERSPDRGMREPSRVSMWA